MIQLYSCLRMFSFLLIQPQFLANVIIILLDVWRSVNRLVITFVDALCLPHDGTWRVLRPCLKYSCSCLVSLQSVYYFTVPVHFYINKYCASLIESYFCPIYENETSQVKSGSHVRFLFRESLQSRKLIWWGKKTVLLIIYKL